MVATPDPTTGTVLSSTAWGHDVYLDLSRMTNVQNTNVLGSASLAGSSSTSYVDVGSTSFSYTKQGGSTDSDVVVWLNCTCYVSVASTAPMFGISLAGTDYDIWFMIINPINQHTPFAGSRRISGISAGALSPKLRFKRSSGTGTTTIDTGDSVSLTIGEIPK